MVAESSLSQINQQGFWGGGTWGIEVGSGKSPCFNEVLK